MKKTTLSFHAARGDVHSILSPWIMELKVAVAGERFFPAYEVSLIEDWSIGPAVLDSLNRISLHLGNIDLAVSSALGFTDANPSGLAIVLGRDDENGLRESFLGATTDDEAAIRAWRKVRNGFQGSMNKGAWIVNTGNGTRVRDESHLYASGAKLLQERGVPILGNSERIQYELD